MRNGPGRGDWGSIDWSRVDLPGLRRTGGPRRPRNRVTSLITIVVLAVFLLPLVFGPLVGFLTDLLWFRSLGLEDVFLRRYTAGFYAFLLFLVAFFLLALPNLYFALRPQVPRIVVDAAAQRRTGALAPAAVPVLYGSPVREAMSEVVRGGSVRRVVWWP